MPDRDPGVVGVSSEILRALRRFWALALIVVLAFGGLGVLYASSRTPTATATASLLVQNPLAGGIFTQGSTDATYVANQVATLGLSTTAQAAAGVLVARGFPSYNLKSLSSALVISNTQGDDLITLSYTDRSPRVAQAVVNAYVTAYTDGLAARATRDRATLIGRLDDALADVGTQISRASKSSQSGLQGTYDDLVRRKAEAIAIDPSGSAGVQTVSEAALPVLGRPARRSVSAVLGAALGLVVAAALCYVLAHARRRFSDRFEPETVIGVPLLTEVPDFRLERLSSDVPVIDAPVSAAAEAFRFGSTLLGVRQNAEGSRVHAIVSAASQDGKSTISANLAITTAQAGKRVLAVDGDLGGRGLSFLLMEGRSDGPGLVDVLEGRLSLASAVVEVPLAGGTVLHLLRGGTDSGDAGRLLSSARSQRFLGGLRADYDEVIVDVPPVLQVAYASSLVRAADDVVVVVPHHAAMGPLETLIERLGVLQADVVGYFYNLAPLRRELGVQSRLVTDVRRRPQRRSAASPARVPVGSADGWRAS